MADIDQIISPDALKGVDTLYDRLGKVVEQLDRAAQSSASLDASMSKMAGAASGAGVSMTEVNSKIKEGQAINVQYRNTSEEIVKAKLQFARANKQQRDELGALIVLEDREAGTLEKLAARNKLLREEQRKLNLETKEGIKRNKEINREIDSNTAFVKKNSDALVKQKMNIGNYQSALSGLPGPMGIVITTIQSFSKVFLMNPIGAAIMAIVGAIALLIKAFKGTEEGGDRMKRMFDQIKATIDAVFDRVKNLALGLAQVFKGEKKLRDLKGTFAGLGDEIKREVELAGQLADMMERLEDREIDMITISADRKASIDKLMEAASDQTKSERERLGLLTQAKKLIDEEAAAQQSLLLTRIANELGMTDEAKVLERINQVRKEGKQITLEEIGLSISTNADRKRVNELLAQYIGLEEQAAAESRRVVSRLSSLKKSVEEQDFAERRLNETTAAKIQTTRAATDAVTEYFDKVNEFSTTELKFNEELRRSNEQMQQEKIAQLDEEAKARSQVAQLQIDIANSAFELAASLFDRQSSKLEAAYQKEVAAAGDNAEKKAKIDEKYDKKRREIMRKQAIADKVQALFNIGINTAIAITKALAETLGVLVPWVAALGAIQAAAVIATPIPQYAKGTPSSKGGLAVVGEKGRELMIDPSGRVSLTGESAHLTMLRPGTKIIPSDETSAIMRAAAVSKRSTIEDTIKTGNKEIVEAIRRQRIEIAATTGRSITVREGNQWREYFNRHIQ